MRLALSTGIGGRAKNPV